MCHKPDCVGLCFNVLHVFRFMVFISLVSNCIFDSVLTRNTKYSGSCPDYGHCCNITADIPAGLNDGSCAIGSPRWQCYAANISAGAFAPSAALGLP